MVKPMLAYNVGCAHVGIVTCQLAVKTVATVD